MSTTSVGQIGLDLVVNKKPFEKQMSGMMGLAKKAGAALTAAFAVNKIIKFGKECLELGSDLQEVQNVVDVTFPKMSAQVDSFAQKAAASFGLSETMAKKYTGTFGSMAKAFGFTEEAAYEMGTTLTKLSGDVASFYNLSQDEAYTKLKSVFTGETESLKELGVVMTQSALDQYALANGFGKTTKAMSEAEKVALRYSFVQNQLTSASGDFARTSGNWANQVKILKLQFESLKASLGQGFINLFTPILKVINSIIGKLMSLANAFKAFTELITGNKTSPIKTVSDTGKTATTNLNNATSAADNLTKSTNNAGKAAENTAKKMRQLMGFDAINKLSDESNNGSSSSAGGGSGVGGIFGDTFDFGAIDEASSTNGIIGKLSETFERLANGIQKFKEEVDWDLINEKLNKFREALKPLADNIGEGLMWFYEEVLVPLGIWIMNEIVTRFLDNLANIISILNSVINIAKPLLNWLWENFLKPLVSFTGDVFLAFCDDFIAKTEWIANIVKELEKVGEIDVKATFKATVDKTFESAKKKFESIKNSKAVKTLTAIVDKAWTSVKKRWDSFKNLSVAKTLKAKMDSSLTKFKKTWDSLRNKTLTIKANVSAAITNIKKLINDKIIAKLNNAITVLNKLPGVNVKKIPKLASGGYVKRNTPQLAIIGDNMRHGEVVAPEDKLLAMARQAAAMSGGNNNAEIISLLRQILTLLQTLNLVATIDVDGLKKLIVRLINENTKATGRCEIIV